ncbi:MAG TPA: hypothetical protein VLH40_01585 [Atribacteraceae bacterium]|nr:hypothetical protein [Atribacteraceae bacterium]
MRIFPAGKVAAWTVITLIFFIVLTAAIGVLARERTLFIDKTADNVFSPLKNFLITVPTFDLVDFGDLPFRQQLGLTDLLNYPDPDYDFLFYGYERDDLLFFEGHDSFRSQKILGMVRKRNEHASMIDEIIAHLSRFFGLHRETKLLFSRREQDISRIILSTLDGKEQAVLFSLEDGNISDLWMSPDTRSVVFTTDLHYIYEIYRFNLETTDLRELAGGYKSNRYPSSLTDQREIIFWSNRNGRNDLYQMNDDGSVQRLLYSSTYPLREPAASSDGRLIAYCVFRNGQWNLQVYDTLEMGSRMVPFDGNVSHPRFSPNGKQLIFVGEASGNYDLFVFDLFHDNIQRLTFDSFPKEYPSFSPDGQWVTYAGRKEVGWDIFLVSPDNHIVRRVTSCRADDRFPSFTPFPVY